MDKPTPPKLTAVRPPLTELKIEWAHDPLDGTAMTSGQRTVIQVHGEATCPRCKKGRPMWHELIEGQYFETHRMVKCGHCAKPIWGRIADRVREARNERELDRWAFEDRHRDDDGVDDWAALPWWRRTWARITGRWTA